MLSLFFGRDGMFKILFRILCSCWGGQKRASFQGRLAALVLEGEEQLLHCLLCSVQAYAFPSRSPSYFLVAMAGVAGDHVVEELAPALGPVPELLEGGADEAEAESIADEAPELDQAVALHQLAQAAAGLPGGAVNVADRVSQLKAQQAALREEGKRVQQNLRNEERKRRRLMEKARNLSAEDLVVILGARAFAKGKAKAKAKAKAVA